MEEISEDYTAYVKEGERRWMTLLNDIIMNEAGPYFFGAGNWKITSLEKLLICGIQLVLPFCFQKLENVES
jgi:hypothetical protein